MRWSASMRSAGPRSASAGLLLAALMLLSLPVPGVAIGPPAAPRHAAFNSASVSPLLSAERSLGNGAGPAAGSPWSCRGSAPTCGPVSAAAAPPTAGLQGWRKLGPLTPPPDPSLLAYDAADGYVLALQAPSGNHSAIGWRYVGGAWSPLAMTNTPSLCEGGSMAYDPAVGEVVLLQGAGNFATWASPSWPGCSGAGSTWVYSAGAWTRLAEQPGAPINDTVPFTRMGAALAFDPSSNAIALFGGLGVNSGMLNDTWKFSSGLWTRVSSGGRSVPPAREDAGFALDPASGRPVLYGGYTPGSCNGSSYGCFYNDTWSFNGSGWLRAATTGPAWVASPLLAPDTVANDLVMLPDAGYSSGGTRLSNTTYVFQAGVWQSLPTSAARPPGRPQLGAYDAHDGYLIVLTVAFPGVGSEGSGFLGRFTWGYSNGTFQNRTGTGSVAIEYASPPNDPATVSAYVGPSSPIVYDPADQEVVFFGGPSMHETWVFQHSSWRELALTVYPSGRYGDALGYDARDGYVVLFGGYNSTALGDTWEFVADRWTELTPSPAPPPRVGAYLSYDDRDGYLLLIGGRTLWQASSFAAEGWFADSWAYRGGTWSNLTSSAGAPPGVPIGPPVYDNSTGSVLLFGWESFASGETTNATWQFSSGRWQNISANLSGPPGAPFVRYGGSILYDPPLGALVEFGGTDLSGAFAPGTWLYAGDRWSASPVGISPDLRSGAAFAFDVADNEAVLLGGVPASPSGCLLACDASWVWGNGSTNFPLISQARWSISPLEVGVPATLTAQVIGDANPLTYQYAGLPPGCAPANSSEITCSPTAPGEFSVFLTVTDSEGNSSLIVVASAVVADPSVPSFSAAPSPVTVGNRTILSAPVANGTPPYAYRFVGLPPGCPSQDVPTFPCYPGAAGNYSVTVDVTDRWGETNRSSLVLSVWPLGLGTSIRLASFVATPEEIPLGNSTTLQAVATEQGGRPLTYNYSGLPPGCASASNSTLACAPTVSGAYTVVLNVTDGTGARVSTGTHLLVDPVGGGLAPTVYAFEVSPAVVRVNQTVNFTLVARGPNGSSPTYSYAGLPVGCLPQNSSHFACVPRVEGGYRIVATVSAPSGHAASVGSSLQVIPEISTPPGKRGGSVAWTPLVGSVALGLVAGALAVVPLAIYLRRRTLRREGDEILRELMRRSEPAEREGRGGA